MIEKVPIPISHGIEIQTERIEDIRRIARDRYKSLIELSQKVETKIDAALNDRTTSTQDGNLAQLFEQKKVLDEISRALEEIILTSFEQHGDLVERWMLLQERMASTIPVSTG